MPSSLSAPKHNPLMPYTRHLPFEYLYDFIVQRARKRNLVIVPTWDRPRTRSTYRERHDSEPTVDNKRVVDLEETHNSSVKDKQLDERMLLELVENLRRRRLATSRFPTNMGL
uniref:Uncharacterized protein LOC114914295 n=1 Tax=Elaeis guineensis var. tenera TaxID=51953 RepID=A0A8N4F490_ELAGV|nr:uncharacterized protein LOC114914295 [Elaeis guineensis]